MEKMTFRQKIENFWYHNKVAIIVIPIFLAFAIIATVQLFTKDEPDANFLYMGPARVAFKGEGLLQDSIAKVMKEDYNNDGKKYIDYIELTAIDTDNRFDENSEFSQSYTPADVQKSVGESFAAQIIAGDSMIYLLDEKYYDVAESTGVLMPLSEALGYTPDFAVTEYAVYLKDLDIYYMPGFELLPASTMLCIRYPVTLSNGKKEVERREKCNISVFRDMFSYVYADKPVVIVKTPENVTLDEFKIKLKEFSDNKKLGLTDEEIASLKEIGPENFFELTGANLFKSNYKTYLCYLDEIYIIGKYIGGSGVIDLEVCDLNSDEKNELVFSYTYKGSTDVVSSVSVFDFALRKETFLQIESPFTLLIELNEKSQIDVYGTEEGEFDLPDALSDIQSAGIHLYTVYGDKSDYLLKIYD